MPKRLCEWFGPYATSRVVVIGAQDKIGPNPRPYVAEAFDSLGVEAVLGSHVVSVGSDGVRTASGTHIEAMTVIWAGGMRASPLAAHVSSRLDPLGRVEVPHRSSRSGRASCVRGGRCSASAERR